MRAPKWIRRWTSTRARYERQIDDADHRAATAVKAAGALREQLALCRLRYDDARVRAAGAERQATQARAAYDAAQRAATGHARTIGRVRQLLDEYGRVESGLAPPATFMDRLRKALDDWEPDR